MEQAVQAKPPQPRVAEPEELDAREVLSLREQQVVQAALRVLQVSPQQAVVL